MRKPPEHELRGLVLPHNRLGLGVIMQHDRTTHDRGTPHTKGQAPLTRAEILSRVTAGRRRDANRKNLAAYRSCPDSATNPNGNTYGEKS